MLDSSLDNSKLALRADESCEGWLSQVNLRREGTCDKTLHKESEGCSESNAPARNINGLNTKLLRSKIVTQPNYIRSFLMVLVRPEYVLERVCLEIGLFKKKEIPR